jgi:hypothetical protein
MLVLNWCELRVIKLFGLYASDYAANDVHQELFDILLKTKAFSYEVKSMASILLGLVTRVEDSKQSMSSFQ